MRASRAMMQSKSVSISNTAAFAEERFRRRRHCHLVQDHILAQNQSFFCVSSLTSLLYCPSGCFCNMYLQCRIQTASSHGRGLHVCFGHGRPSNTRAVSHLLWHDLHPACPIGREKAAQGLRAMGSVGGPGTFQSCPRSSHPA